MLQAPADEPEESCGKVKASGEAACSCRVSPQPAAASPACSGRCHLQDRIALYGIPVGIAWLGFTAGGIAAGSIAAKMMSAAAIANGGGVAAGSTVAVLQSIGDSQHALEQSQHRCQWLSTKDPQGEMF
ncbi:hypothetical protein BTVI_152554 [Pitangus sulphuratus]|nr:hypothetical protein BTVI_152554 [Pitangus sulphuratus]